MAKLDLFNPKQLRSQIDLQKKQGWREQDIPYSSGIDIQRKFLPLGEDHLFFPNASAEQALALSQLFGLIVNETISEMECCLPRLKYIGWEMMLKRYPNSPELEELGELFFTEEEKHANAFHKYLETFCTQMGIDADDLKLLLPRAYNSHFQNSIIENAKNGGHAFWWIVAAVEDVSIQVFKEIRKHKDDIDPLYYHLHQLHAAEEARHENYAFLMLQLAKENASSLKEKWNLKKDLLLAQTLAPPWLVTELTKVLRAKELQHKHPWFATIASALPLMQDLSPLELAKRCWYQAPYIGWLINPKFQKKNLKHAQSHGALSWVSQA